MLINVTFYIKNKTILIFEAHKSHYECTPGFAKYLIDFGYNVDIIMNEYGKDTFNFAEYKDKIRLMIYNTQQEISSLSNKLRNIFINYSSIIIETATPDLIPMLSELELLQNDKVIYVFHFTKYFYYFNFSNYINPYRIWTLGNFEIGNQVNPHYFGKFKIKNKNKRTRFFTVSTRNRNYNFLISASEKLREENFDFEIVMTGSKLGFSNKSIINEKLKNNFIM